MIKRLVISFITVLLAFELSAQAPLIGVSPGGGHSYSMNRNYFDAVKKAGGIPLMLPMVYSEEDAETVMSRIGGLLMTGGEDVAPAYYGEEILNSTVYSNSVRDSSDFFLIRAAIRQGVPILGTCRGEQIVNVVLGGKLYQDLPVQVGETVNHRGMHIAYIERESLLYRLIGKDSVMVNSSHHQGVKVPGDGVIVSARAADGVVEAYECGPDIFCIQFHPEVLISKGDDTFLPIYTEFIRRASHSRKNSLIPCEATPVPRLVTDGEGHYELLVDGAPYFILGGQCGNSSNWPAALPKVWETMEAMNANTLEVPIYWEQIEPAQGRYDFSSLELLLNQARENDIRLVLLWFATWKNGSNHYMPQWMKLQSDKYPNIVGKDGQQIDSPSPHCTAAMEADARAFSEVMKYLLENDPCHTVIMMQIENEPGSWDSVRDYSRTADKLFAGKVPAALLRKDCLSELGAEGHSGGSWSEVFGSNADEYFHAWSVASYIEYIAAAGKAVNPLPMYVNVALRDPLSNPPASSYESGGATDNVIAIYKAAAPHIDFVAPDIYLSGDAAYTGVLGLYSRRDNALMVPETVCGPNKYLYEVVSRGIGFSPFGVDGSDIKKNDPLSLDYAILKPISDKIAHWTYQGQVFSAFEPEDHTVRRIDLGEWEAILTFGEPRRSNEIAVGSTADRKVPAVGKAMIVKLGEGDFLTAGNNVRYTFRPKGKNVGRPWHYLRVEEGYYDENGEWILRRVLNGDETDWTGPYIGSTPTWLHIIVYSRNPAK